MWKEDSLSDWSYLTADGFVVCMETVTAVFWEASLFRMHLVCVSLPTTGFGIDCSPSSGVGQLYGDVLYYHATCMFERAVMGYRALSPGERVFLGVLRILERVLDHHSALFAGAERTKDGTGVCAGEEV